jgi:hypothetical protein
MQPFRADSNGWPGSPYSESSSHHARHRLSRRAFIGGAAATATGASLGSMLAWPAAGSAAAFSGRAPKPTTNTVTINGVDFHFTFFGQGMDPSSITDFKGVVGVADVRGKGTARRPDGSVETLLFDTDMRFMKGVYVGQDGAVHRGTFGFVWLDLYRGRFDLQNFTTQVHDFDPGIHPYPGGLFWTVPLRSDDEGGEGHSAADEDDGGGVTVDLDEGTARMRAADLHVRDFFNIPNALFRFQTPASVAATVSFDIRWLGPATHGSPVTSPPGSSGRLFTSPVTMTWSATSASGFSFKSNPSGTRSFFGQLGRVRNGIFSDWHSRS